MALVGEHLPTMCKPLVPPSSLKREENMIVEQSPTPPWLMPLAISHWVLGAPWTSSYSLFFVLSLYHDCWLGLPPPLGGTL